MPAVHRRVRLAVRLDEVERRQSKERAEKSWRQQHAEQLGIELSDESEGEPMPPPAERPCRVPAPESLQWLHACLPELTWVWRKGQLPSCQHPTGRSCLSWCLSA
jgi:hypothetical protein